MSENLKTWPERVYLQHGADGLPIYPGAGSDVTWSEKTVANDDIEYIRSDMHEAQLRAVADELIGLIRNACARSRYAVTVADAIRAINIDDVIAAAKAKNMKDHKPLMSVPPQSYAVRPLFSGNSKISESDRSEAQELGARVTDQLTWKYLNQAGRTDDACIEFALTDANLVQLIKLAREKI